MSKSIKLKNNMYLDLSTIANECVTYTLSGMSVLSSGKIPFDTIYSKTEKNDSFQLDGNDVLFLKKGKFLVSMTIAMHLNATSIWLGVNLNNKRIGTIIETSAQNGYKTYSLANKLIDVNINDKLSVGVVSTDNNIMIGANLSNIDAVYLTIQKIN